MKPFRICSSEAKGYQKNLKVHNLPRNEPAACFSVTEQRPKRWVSRRHVTGHRCYALPHLRAGYSVDFCSIFWMTCLCFEVTCTPSPSVAKFSFLQYMYQEYRELRAERQLWICVYCAPPHRAARMSRPYLWLHKPCQGAR